MKKDIKKVGKGELENRNLKRLLDQHEEEELAEAEIREYIRRSLLTEEEEHD